MSPPWPARPYRGLSPYRPEDAALFVGRDREIKACLDRLCRTDIYVFVVHGLSGTGKSSFLRAGLLPFLGGARGPYRLSQAHGRDPEDTVIIRSGPDPLKELAGRLWDQIVMFSHENASSHPDGDPLVRARQGFRSREEFIEGVGGDHEAAYRALQNITRSLSSRYVLIIDQLEELFFDSQPADPRCKVFCQFLSRIAERQPELKLLIGIRTEFKAKLDEALDALDVDRAAMGSYQLLPISKEGLLEAILRPTDLPISNPGEELPKAPYRFSFEPGLAELIRDDVASEKINASTWLPVMQVICDRLSPKPPILGKVPHIIRIADYRITGACSAQVSSHLAEKIAKGLRIQGEEKKLAQQEDQWKAVLFDCTQLHSDGHVTARAPISHSKLVKFANHHHCHHIDEMLDWLAEEQNYILQKVIGTTGEEGYSWRLLHDIVAVAVVELHRSESRHHHRPMLEADPLLDSAEESYVEWYGPTIAFSTINDLIWDHQIALFAESKGFTKRLGLLFEVESDFDLTRHEGPIDYSAFLTAPQKHENRLLILPLFMLDELQNKSWTVVGVPNIYRGYAIVGPELEGLESLHQWHEEHKHLAEVEKLLDSLAEHLSDPNCCIGVFEDKSLQFVNLLLEMTGKPNSQNIKRLGITEEGRPTTSTPDILFSELVAGRIHFALGPAPSRALAEQAGFVVYADFEDIRLLAEAADRRRHRTGNEAKHPSFEERLIELLMPEGWTVDVPSGDRATLLRLTALMFYTVDYIRRTPEDFVSFLYDQCLLAQDDGAYWLQRSFIRRAVKSCYEYHASMDYAFRVATLPQCFGIGAASESPYQEWLRLRAECDDLIAQLLRVHISEWPEQTHRHFRIGKKRYMIYDYFDAKDAFQTAFQELGFS